MRHPQLLTRCPASLKASQDAATYGSALADRIMTLLKHVRRLTEPKKLAGCLSSMGTAAQEELKDLISKVSAQSSSGSSSGSASPSTKRKVASAKASTPEVKDQLRSLQESSTATKRTGGKHSCFCYKSICLFYKTTIVSSKGFEIFQVFPSTRQRCAVLMALRHANFGAFPVMTAVWTSPLESAPLWLCPFSTWALVRPQGCAWKQLPRLRQCHLRRALSRLPL